MPFGVRTFLEGFSLPPRSLSPHEDGSPSPSGRKPDRWAPRSLQAASNILAPMLAAVVTGAGSGLGRAIAVELARRSFVVLATDLDAGAAAETAEAIGAGAVSMQLDVRDQDACRAAVAAAVSRSGSLDLWVNNAGVLITGNSWEQDEADAPNDARRQRGRHDERHRRRPRAR